MILDLVMPILDGISMFREMKRDPTLADLPVIITTSDPSLAPSGVLIMRKPVDLGILINNVRKCCGSPMSATGS